MGISSVYVLEVPPVRGPAVVRPYNKQALKFPFNDVGCMYAGKRRVLFKSTHISVKGSLSQYTINPDEQRLSSFPSLMIVIMSYDFRI